MNNKIYRAPFRASSFFSVVLVTAPASLFAGGFALNEQSASAMGVANAGAAANPDNATIVYFNPAGMSHLEGTNLSFGAAVLDITGEFEGSATRGDGTLVEGGNGGDFVPLAVLPNVYMTHELNDSVDVGFGLHAPYGLKADYDNDFKGRFYADKTELEIISFSPSIAFNDNNGFSAGFGVNVMYATGRLSKFQEFSALGQSEEGYVDVEGDDIGVTFTAGILYSPNDRTDLGLSFRSGIELELDGDATLTNAPVFGAAGPTGQTQTLTEKARVPLEIPESLTFGARHQLTDSVTLLAGATWAKWSRFEALDVISRQSNAGTPNQTISFLGERKYGGEGTIGHVPENWKDTWSASIGTIWQATQAWAFKAGYAFDESPVNEDFRTARIPSDDRHWLTLGAQYADQPSGWTVDVAAGILLIDDVDINEVEYTLEGEPVGGPSNVSGTYELDAWGAALQVSKAF